MQGKIIKIVSKEYTVQLTDGQTVLAVAMGKLRQGFSPVIGDEVECEALDGQWGIQQIFPRRNQLIRPRCANVDQALIVMSVKDPDFSSTLIDRLSFLIRHAGIQPVLCVTKCDMGMSKEVEAELEGYEHSEIPTIRTSKTHVNPLLHDLFKNKITVLCGQSGAGKSSLLNALEPSFQLKTQEISKALGRGKHTTRHSQLHPVCGGLVADTPGFSSLDFSHISKEELANCVLEFEPYLGNCRFRDCLHDQEPDCCVKDALHAGKLRKELYDHYVEILHQIQNRKPNF